ncbi:universal stress protein [Dactylosporangium sp. CA-233914]|uniref:universal stress protein n=1 Tax=Dactylosporangium sp. CA-233914 TaxID=3239934 RepID=UPI003D8C4A96
MNTPRIVVGYDGSGETRAAVDWAAAEAARTAAPLLIVHAYQFVWPAGYDSGASIAIVTAAQARARHALGRILEHVHRLNPGIAATGTAVPAPPAAALLDAARDARLLVVGNHGGGGVAGLLLGSVSQQVATRSPVPVAVVRGRATAAEGPVVVGVNDSPSCDATLALAFDAAAARGTGVVAIRAYPPPSPAAKPLSAAEANELAALDASLAGWPGKYPGVPLDATLTAGRPARVLIGASRTAQLVVVGGRDHNGLAGVVLGSVGQRLMHHARCPVLITHRKEEAA